MNWFGNGISFLSIAYVGFLFFAFLVRYLFPKKARTPALLILSWLFYASYNPLCLLFLLFSTLTTYLAGIFVGEKLGHGEKRDGKRRAVLALCLVLNLGALFFCKYWEMFFPGTFENRLIPIGISFYTLQVVGYLVDCYRYGRSEEKDASSAKGKKLSGIRPEHSFVRYALFVSFFPGILSGPIERARNMLPQYEEEADFDYESLRNGLLILLFGYLLKMVLADRIAIVVDTVYENPQAYQGTIVVLAVFLYALQIYCDFAGYSAIAIGSARILGFRVMSNFLAPYLASSLQEFWRLWHISLSSWYRDYLYIPLGGSKRGTLRKYANLLIVFAVSGLWHGAGVTFLFWGLLHGIYQVVGAALLPLRDKVVCFLHIDRESFSHRLLKTAITFLLVAFAWIFFRADSMEHAFLIIRSMKGFQPWKLFDGSLLNLGLDFLNWTLLSIGLCLLLIRDLCVRGGICLREKLLKQGIWLRWSLYILAVLLILVCGIWGPGYDASTFIYSQF